MKSKFTLIVMTLFGFLLMFCVGFSSWVLTNPLEQQVGSIESIVYESHDNAKYIQIVGSEVFDYYNTGFVINDVTISKNGQIIATFTLNLENYIADFGNTGMTIELLLKHASTSKDLDVFATSAPFKISSTVSGELGATSNSSSSTQGCLTTIDLSVLPDATSVTFTVTYDLNFTGSHAEFKSQVFEKIQNVRFAIEAKVTSK